MNWLASENGYVLVCGHRGDSIAAPENTIAALASTYARGGNTAEIDIMLSQDGELYLIHDLTLGRTSNGKGLVAHHHSNQLDQLDAGSWFDARFKNETLPSLDRVLLWAKDKLGLVIEIKEQLRVEDCLHRLKQLLDAHNAYERVMIISFDHHVLQRLKVLMPQVKTEGITHARHVDFPLIAARARLNSLSIELAMFHPDDARALHEAGIAIRCHLPRPERIAQLDAWGFGVTESVASWLAQGLIDSLSGDDVSYLHYLVKAHPLG